MTCLLSLTKSPGRESEDLSSDALRRAELQPAMSEKRNNPQLTPLQDLTRARWCVAIKQKMMVVGTTLRVQRARFDASAQRE